jgi:UPF0755 protein
MSRKKKSGCGPLLLIFVGVVIGAILATAHWLVRVDRYGAFQEPVIVEIPRGTSTVAIGETLAAKGVLRYPWLFALARLTDFSGKPQAGEYEFKDAAAPAEVFARIARGDVYTKEFRVPEGSDVFDIAALVEQGGFGSTEEFLAIARSPALIRDLAPNAPSLEGFLFPSTYRFRPKAKPEEIARAMTGQFRKMWKSLNAPIPAQEAVILASLVETEAKVDSERSRIAAVYQNRLEKGMKLDADPTVIYAAKLAGRWRGTIFRSDLDRNSPYNTYLNPGLPPGPVANPGLKSIEAALHPDKTNELFFVAEPNGTGQHVFSESISAHEKAVTEYRRAETNSGKSKAPGTTGNPGPRPRH